MRTLFPYLGNGWTDCSVVWYVARGQFAKQLTQESIQFARSSPKRRLTGPLYKEELRSALRAPLVIIADFSGFIRNNVLCGVRIGDGEKECKPETKSQVPWGIPGPGAGSVLAGTF